MGDKLRNLIVRTLSGIVLLAVVVAAAWFGRFSYGALLLAIVAVGVWEFYSLARAKGVSPQRCLGLLLSIAIFLTAFAMFIIVSTPYEKGVNDNTTIIMVADASAGVGFGLATLLLFLMFVVEVFRNKENPIHNIGTTLMGVVYVAMPMSIMLFVPLLLSANGEMDYTEWQPEYFLLYLFLVWGNDVFAYLVGILFGRHKMCVRLSPKKSWEGFFGGIAGSLAMGALAAWYVDGSYAMWMGLAVVVSLTSVIGDLVESMFKRDAGVKDSGNIMPGHGGMLDRFDALILSAPFAAAYMCICHIIF